MEDITHTLYLWFTVIFNGAFILYYLLIMIAVIFDD